MKIWSRLDFRFLFTQLLKPYYFSWEKTQRILFYFDIKVLDKYKDLNLHIENKNFIYFEEIHMGTWMILKDAWGSNTSKIKKMKDGYQIYVACKWGW